MLLIVFHASCGYLPFREEYRDKVMYLGKNN